MPSEYGDDFKPRWGIVLVQKGDLLYCVITTTRPEPREDKIPLPSGPHSPLGLPRKSWAVCRWRHTIEREDVIGTGRIVHDRVLRPIMEMVRRLIAEKQATRGT